MTQEAQFFCSFRIGWGTGFGVPIVFQPVPSLFLPSTQSLFIMLNLFLTFPISSQCVSNSTTLYPICFAQRFIIVTYITKPKEKIWNTSILGVPKNLITFSCDGPIEGAHCLQKKFEPWVSPQLMNVNYTTLCCYKISQRAFQILGCHYMS
jgi:hypothetical protein